MESWVARIIADALGFQYELIVKVRTRLRRFFHSGIHDVWTYTGSGIKRLIESAGQGKSKFGSGLLSFQSSPLPEVLIRDFNILSSIFWIAAIRRMLPGWKQAFIAGHKKRARILSVPS
jgi:hypothetical protein